MTACEEEGGNGGRRDGRGGCKASVSELLVAGMLSNGVRDDSLLTQVDLLMPLPPDFGGCEHASRSALITEGCLTCSMCTTARDSRNTCDSSTCLFRQCILLSVG